MDKNKIIILRPTIIMTELKSLNIFKSDLIYCRAVDLQGLENFKRHYFLIMHPNFGLILRRISIILEKVIIVQQLDEPVLSKKMNVADIKNIFKVDHIITCCN